MSSVFRFPVGELTFIGHSKLLQITRFYRLYIRLLVSYPV